MRYVKEALKFVIKKNKKIDKNKNIKEEVIVFNCWWYKISRCMKEM
jgi:hypothetical protein